MKKLKISGFLFNTLWIGWRRWVTWTVCIGAIFLPATLQVATDAESAFTSMELLPVLLISWVGGKRNGLIAASLAAVIWAVSDIALERQFSAQWIPWANGLTRMMTYSLVAILAAQVRLQFVKEHELAMRDSLTGLQNRRAFLEAGESEVERARRYGHPIAVMFLDLDDFKKINDTLGHDAGDLALKATAGALLRTLRSTDRVARLGGDEFAALLPETGYEATVETGRKICSAVNGALGNFPPARGSVGVAWFAQADRSFPAMLKAADELMYEVKGSGKNDMRSHRFAAAYRSDSEG